MCKNGSIDGCVSAFFFVGDVDQDLEETLLGSFRDRAVKWITMPRFERRRAWSRWRHPDRRRSGHISGAGAVGMVRFVADGGDNAVEIVTTGSGATGLGYIFENML